MEFCKDVISAVVVTYNPSEIQLINLVSTLSKEVGTVYIIDNSDRYNDIVSKLSHISNCNIIKLDGNKGISLAQNIGFHEAIKGHFDYVVTFDQDSNIPNGWVKAMFREYQRALDAGIDLACIGPSVINERDGTEYTKSINKGDEVADNLYSVATVMSSGSFYSTKIFAEVGFNKSNWFIDGVEIEWCFRARYIGKKVLVTRNVKLFHNLGENDISLPFFGSFPIGSYFRLYYVFRNWILAMREPCFPISYKLKTLIKIPIKFFIFASISPRRKRARMMVRGLIDGILNKSNNFGRIKW